LEINIFWRHFLLNENDVFWSKQRRFLNCSLKKKREEARNGVVLNDTVLLLLPLDVQQGKKKVFEFVFFPHSLSLPNLTKH
jgi:hypothetical protein